MRKEVSEIPSFSAKRTKEEKKKIVILVLVVLF